MKKLLVDTIYAILAFQKKCLKWYYDFRYAKYSKTGSVSSKTHITANETLHLTAQEKLDAKEVVENAKSIFKEHLNEPQKVFDYIRAQGTPVFRFKNATKILWFAGEDEGFITPKSGIQAILLCLCINLFSPEKINFAFKTPAIFVIKDTDLSPYFLAYQLYHWMAFSKNLSGYDEKTVRNFKNIFNLEKDIMARKSLSIEEILSLKEAIARDVEAINMVTQLALEISGQKNASDKLKKDGNISI